MSDSTFSTVDSSYGDSNFKRGDVVKMYKEDTKLQYPCIMLTCDKLELFRVEAMRGILGAKSLLINDSNYAVYIEMQNQLTQIGVIPTSRLKIILDNKVFSIFEKKVHLDDQTTVTGDLLYALCTSSI